MIVNFLVPVFMGLGMAHGAAVLAASLVGPAQVAGRLVLMRYENRIGTGAATILTIGVSLVATLCLWAAGLGPGLIFAYAILQGAAMGIVTILRPVMISEVLGQAGYGAIAGVIQIPSLLAGAMAPLLGAAILAGPGIGALLGLSIVLSLCAMAAVAVLRRLP
jgi:MFS family permease